MSLSSRNKPLVASFLALMLGGVTGLPSWAAENDAPVAPQRGGAANDDAAVDQRDARRRRANDNDWFRDPSFREGSVNGEFPSAEVGDFVVANARAATARMVYRRAESNLNQSVRDAKRQFEASAELKQALAAEKEAHAAFERARRRALESVVARPRYQAIMAIRQDLGEKIADRRAAAHAEGATALVAHPQSEVFTMAAYRLEVSHDARAMERAAIESSQELLDARKRLVAAAQKVSDLRQEFDSALRDDPDLLAARNALADARISKVAAAAYLRGSRMAAEQAVDFAYYLHRHDSQVSYDPYVDYYSPYGGGGGYYYSSRYRYGRY